MHFAVFLIVLNIFKICLARYLPLIGDEAFYWLWSKHLDLSYVDHPPMIAYYIKGLTLLFGNTELAIRLGAILLVTLTTWLVYKIGQELFSQQAGIISAVIFNLLPIFFGGSLFLVPQQPFLFYWALSLYLFCRLIKTSQPWLWLALGTTVGLGLLSDYVMLLFFPAVGLYLILNKEQRFWLSKLQPYAAALLALAIFSPVIIWNLKQGFVPLFYWSGKMGGTPNYLQNLLSFIALETALYTPIVFGAVFYLLWQLRKFDPRTTLLAAFSLPVLLVFLALAPLMTVGGHWPAAAYLPAVLLLGQLSGKTRTWLVGLTLFFALLLNSLALGYYLFFFPTPPELIGQEFTINQKLPEFIKNATPKNGYTFYLANNLGLAGLVAFHGHVTVQMAPGRLRQFDLWGKPALKNGDNALYFALNEKEVYDQLILLFQQVTKDPQKRIFTKDAEIPSKTEIYHCFGYKGGELP
ncbi:hypothetical protein COT42_00130 [Candidatus Saganbacteria bacterium CG08_land_8_20_14_0_20_45_16]|uniref:Glycosyltransferase RgtA/B/C/D-like domain-containing protein n=1 Tax=Candidatus Saganbacteria bacterium CG08_land_8_20_14_0_20_45_16 TaxID=2014293 RepID=A0A2H0Y2N2_UNCSA|nr:MAG: hypothetical protein COT42_00130 [Candidatus Saganbacteria bacterium CG08_land_8_20_14_0_20_45_16]